jgi:beta-lactamase regulating signal transducer with metallopeptidase domain
MILLDASIRITVVAALVALTLVALRVRSTNVRHAAWTLVLAAMLSMPVLPSIVPAIGVSILGPAAIVLPVSAIRHEVPAHSTTSAIVATANPDRAAPRHVAGSVADGPVQIAPAQSRLLFWPLVTAAYTLVALVLLMRLLVGWRAMVRLARISASVEIPCGAPVLESSLVATPVTAGIFASRIILPSGWRSWPPEKLRACLAHEMAHIRRRDTLVAFLAHINRCVFWFHPLAWWLERTLAASAEDAADEAAIRAIGSRHRYAEVLLDIAEAVRVRGARVAWQAVGAGGTGLLARRVDRVLRGHAAREMSRARTAVVFGTCAAAILLVAACRQQTAAPPLKPDPQVATRLEKQKADQTFSEQAKNMTATEVDALEALLKQAPGDLEARRKLRAFYQSSGQRVFGWDGMVARRRPHILWLIDNHPDQQIALWQVSADADPVTYAEAKRHWLAHSSKPDAGEKVLSNAAHFFARSEPHIAEELLVRLKAPRRLGELYASVITGPTSPRDGSPLTPLDSDAYARDVRAKLFASDDPAVLAIAGRLLSMTYRDEARRNLGRQALQRALTLDPTQEEARRLLAASADHERSRTLREALRTKAAELAGGEIAAKVRDGKALTEGESTRLSDAEERAMSQMPEADRFVLLTELADRHYGMAEYWDHVRNDAKAGARWKRSKQYAQEALALAPNHRDHPDYGYVVYGANVALAANVLREGNRPQAVRHMLAAVDAPPSEKLGTGTWIVTEQRIVNYLLKDGERDSVVQFLERAAPLRPAHHERLLKDAAAIRDGRMPLSYQAMMSR